MNDVKLEEARPDDVGLLAAMMQEFYSESGYSLDPDRSSASFRELLRTPVLGRPYIIMHGSEPAGYSVLTLTFSMEYGGLTAFLDDLYLRPTCRGRGVGSAALALLLDSARKLGVRAVHLEVGRDNAAARSLYRKAGYVDNDRQLLTVQLAAAAHEPEAPAPTAVRTR